MTRYTAYYCEENVWWLAQDPRVVGRAREVVFISNARRACALFHQRAASRPGAPVLWDYHVVLAVRDARGIEVWDLDSTLGAPLDARVWLASTFGPPGAVPEPLAPRFRVIDADAYVVSLASDRGHMRTRAGRYREPPPPWPCIGEGASNLMRFADVTRPFMGELLDLPALASRWAG